MTRRTETNVGDVLLGIPVQRPHAQTSMIATVALLRRQIRHRRTSATIEEKLRTTQQVYEHQSETKRQSRISKTFFAKGPFSAVLCPSTIYDFLHHFGITAHLASKVLVHRSHMHVQILSCAHRHIDHLELLDKLLGNFRFCKMTMVLPRLSFNCKPWSPANPAMI